jgi:excisionase family DNA binding protein
MAPQYTLDVASGDAVVIVTRAATLRVDCHKMDKDWSLLLQYRADSQPPGGRKDAGQWLPLEGQPGQMGQNPMVPTLNAISGQPVGYPGVRQADRPPTEWVPAKGAFGQMVPSHLLTARETAKLLSISERTLFTLTKSGDMKAVRFGQAVRYDPEAIKQWIEQHSRTAGK